MTIADVLSWLILIVLCIGVLAIVVTMVWHLILQTPFIRTPAHVAEAMVRLAQFHGNETVFDLGAGDGTILLAARKNYPHLTLVGYEVVPTVWFLGWFRTFGHHIQFVLGDARHAKISEAEAIFLYVTPFLIQQLLPIFEKHLRAGTTIISHAFQLPGREPVRTERVARRRGETTLYVYTW